MNATVQAVQRRLIALGYDLGPGGADGDTGRFTAAAVAKFQADRKLDIKYPGTIGPKTLKALEIDNPPSALVPPWVDLVKRKMGLHETRDKKELSEFLKSDGHALGDPSKLPWCGDLMETIIAVSLPKEPMIANPYWAANWLRFGVPVKQGEYYLGAIGVKARTGGNHVFTIVGHDKTHVHAAGGNQSDSISVVKIRKDQITGMRFPATYPFPTQQMPLTVFNGRISTKES